MGRNLCFGCTTTDGSPCTGKSCDLGIRVNGGLLSMSWQDNIYYPRRLRKK